MTIRENARWVSPVLTALGFLNPVVGHAIIAPAKLQIPGPNGSGVPWTIVLLLTLLTILPALLLSMTPLVRLLVVFHFLRQALGTQSAPTNVAATNLTNAEEARTATVQAASSLSSMTLMDYLSSMSQG